MVTEKNFWNKQADYEKSCRKEAWQQLKVRFSISLAMATLKRLVASFFVAPALFVFAFFLLEAYNEGLVATLNDVFVGHTEAITASSAHDLKAVWATCGLVFFLFSWLAPWYSPVDSEVQRKMNLWWQEHGSKLPTSDYSTDV